MDRREFVKIGLLSTGLSQLLSLPVAYANSSQKVMDSKLGPAIRVCDHCLEILSKVEDFETLLHKRELHGKRLNETVARVKFRRTPKSIYMIFGKPHEGREALYVEGKNNNELLVHEVGVKSIVGSVSIDPEGKFAMAESHYPITQFGLEGLIKGYRSRWEQTALNPDVEVKYYAKASIGEIACKVIETSYSRRAENVPFSKSRLYLDAKTYLPVRAQNHLFPKKRGGQPILYEEYTYLNMKTNIGLTDYDFDSRNPSYNF